MATRLSPTMEISASRQRGVRPDHRLPRVHPAQNPVDQAFTVYVKNLMK
jgi:hypothetical protein